MQPSGNAYLDQYRSQQASAPAASAPASSSGGGGILGAIGHALVTGVEAPFKTVAKIPSTLYHTGTALDIAGSSILHGQHGAQLAESKAEAENQLQQAPLFANAATPQSFQGGVGKQLEQLGGDTASNAVNLLAPEGGAEAMAGKAGIKQLAIQGAKTGLKYGAAGGASNAAAQGGSLGDIAGGAIEGGAGGAALGGALGGAGSVLGSTLGKVTGRSGPAAADEAGAGASTASGNAKPSGGILPKASANAGARSAQNSMAQQAIDFSGDAEGQSKQVLSHDAQGNPIGIRSVSSFLRGTDMPQDAAGMETLNNTSNLILGGNLKDMTEGTQVNASNARGIGVEAVKDNLGKPTKSGQTGGAADVAMRNIRQSTNNLSNESSVDDVLDSISQLEGHRAGLGKAVNAGDTNATNTDKAYQATIDHLHSVLNSGGVNNAVKDFSVSPQLADSINQDVADAGGSPKLAQHYIDTLNNARSYSDVKSGMQMGVVGGKLAKIARNTFETSVPKAESTKLGGNIPSWEIAMALHNPAYVAAAGARLASNSGIVDRVLSKVNPGAFSAARESALAPDAVTQAKLDNPGVAGTAPVPGVTAPATPAPEVPNAPSPASAPPAPTAEPPAPGPAPSGATPTGQPTNLSFAPDNSGPTPIPVNQATSQLDSALQQLGIRRSLPAEGQPTDNITGPIPNSGATMGAESQPAQAIPVRTQTPTQTASASVPVATRTAPPEPVKVPVTGNQASGPVDTSTPYRIMHVVPPAAKQAIVNAPGNVARTVSQVIRATSMAPARATKSITSNVTPKSLLGALTGSATNQLGQNLSTPGSSSPTSTADAAANPGTDANGTPTQWVTADQNGPTLDASTIPGGTLEDLENEVAADPKNASVYEAIYNDAQDQVKASIPKAPTAAQSAGATAIQDAFGYLDTVEQELQQAGGVNAQAGYEANIPLIGKYLQPGVTAYNETKFDAATALAKALTGRAATAASLKLATASLPSPTDSPQQAAQKLANVRLELANKAPDYGLVPANQ